MAEVLLNLWTLKPAKIEAISDKKTKVHGEETFIAVVLAFWESV